MAFNVYGWNQWEKERKKSNVFRWIQKTQYNKPNLNGDDFSYLPEHIKKRYRDKQVNPAFYGTVTFGHVPNEEVAKFENDYHITE